MIPGRGGALAVLALCLMALGAPRGAQAAPADDLHGLVADVDVFERGLDPVEAGRDGDRDALIRWPDDSLAAEVSQAAAWRGFQARLQAIPSTGLAGEDALNRSFLDYLIADQLQGLAFDPSRQPFSSDNLPFDTPDYTAHGTVIRSREDADAWLQRLRPSPPGSTWRWPTPAAGSLPASSSPGRSWSR